MEAESNGQASMQADACPNRKDDKPHCWHIDGPPHQSPNVTVFKNLCCWCAPMWYRLVVFVPSQIPVEEVVAANYEHGPLVVVQSMPKRGPSIARL